MFTINESTSICQQVRAHSNGTSIDTADNCQYKVTLDKNKFSPQIMDSGSRKLALRLLFSPAGACECLGTDVLVIALGLDAYIGDLFKGLAITTPGFSRIGAAIAGINPPTLLVQEGGYICEELGENLTSILSGFQGV